jgi:IS5 family transposase
MREKCRKQLRLTPAEVDHPHAKELRTISRVLFDNPTIAELAWQDLTANGKSSSRGAPGMTGDLTVRAALLKQMCGFTYDEMAFHFMDSTTYRAFLGLGFYDTAPSKSALQRNIKMLQPHFWQAANRALVAYAKQQGIEDGNKVRIDCTVTKTNIHAPDDAAQLWDVVRVLTRLMRKATSKGFPVEFADRRRAAKHRRLGVMNAKKKEERVTEYRGLVRVSNEVIAFAEAAIERLRANIVNHIAARIFMKMESFVVLGKRVVDQTVRRVFNGEKVPSREKVVSIFEPHTDIIIKDRREVLYGHKLCLAVGASSMILDLMVEDGNPADSDLATGSVKRTIDVTGQVPRQVAMDGGFASRKNLKEIKALGVKDVCFSKGRGIAVSEMVKDEGVYKRLRRFRAGVEGVISFYKRVFEMGRCSWQGLIGFKSYAGASLLACNLLTIARHMLE